MAQEISSMLFDRSKWGPGPWDSEPDKVQWIDDATGLHCLAVRAGADLGHWCGYVALPVGHPWRDNCDDAEIAVHGGITYGPSPCAGKICHVVEHEEDVRWIGFDTAHCGDAGPTMIDRPWARPVAGDVYRDLAFIRTECTSLAAQAAKAGA